MATLRVNSPSKPYSIHIECGLLSRAAAPIARLVPTRHALLVVDRNIAATHGRVLANSMREAGFEVRECQAEANETDKSLDAARSLYSAMVDANLERGSAVIAMGGGIVGDLAGFVAATYMRGVPLVHIPTTLLAMVDASIGGKTAVNFAKPAGTIVKNLIGAFWQPALVLVDPQTLLTLNDRDFCCGLAECVKHAMIADARLFDSLEQNHKAIASKDLAILQQLIERSAAIKIAIVEHDEREQGDRALLNLGHTFAHAIESFSDLDMRHGEAVAIGLCAATHVSTTRGLMTSAERDRVLNLLTTFNLPTRLPRAVRAASLIESMRHDKKVAFGRLRLIVPVGLGAARVAVDVPVELIENAWQSVGAAVD